MSESKTPRTDAKLKELAFSPSEWIKFTKEIEDELTESNAIIKLQHDAIKSGERRGAEKAQQELAALRAELEETTRLKDYAEKAWADQRVALLARAEQAEAMHDVSAKSAREFWKRVEQAEEENEKLRAELEEVKRERDEAVHNMNHQARLGGKEAIRNEELSAQLEAANSARQHAEADAAALREQLRKHRLICYSTTQEDQKVIDALLSTPHPGAKLVEELRRDKERLDWLEAHPNELVHCTWVNVHLGRRFDFVPGRTVGETETTLRAAIDSALARKEGL